jgi:hypothetical protein
MAEQQQWRQVAEVAEEFLNGFAGTVLLATARDVDSEPLKKWLIANAPDIKLTMVSLESLTEDILPSLKAEKVVACFECGRLLEADAVDAVAQALFNRPAHTFAIVLNQAERIETSEELEMIERGVWRLLVADPMAATANEDLLEQDCYLWSESQSNSFMQNRLTRDSNALSGWLHRKASLDEELIRQQVLYVLNQAEAQQSPEASSEDESANPEKHQIRRTLETVVGFRRRLTRRLDADANSITRQLTISLQTLEQDLTADLGNFLLERFPRGTQVESRKVEELIGEHITRGTGRWRLQAEKLLANQNQETTSEAIDLLNDVDWQIINNVASNQGDRRAYPQALLKELSAMPELRLLYPGASSSVVEFTPQGESLSALLRSILAGSTVGAVAISLLGLGPVGTVAAGVMALLSGSMVNRRIQRSHSLREAEEYGRTAIRDFIRHVVSYVQAQTQQALRPLRDAMTSQLRSLEEMLDRALSGTQSSPEMILKPDPSQEVLDSIRSKVMSAGSLAVSPMGSSTNS